MGCMWCLSSSASKERNLNAKPQRASIWLTEAAVRNDIINVTEADTTGMAGAHVEGSNSEQADCNTQKRLERVALAREAA